MLPGLNMVLHPWLLIMIIAPFYEQGCEVGESVLDQTTYAPIKLEMVSWIWLTKVSANVQSNEASA